jgi:hypothetical protein
MNIEQLERIENLGRNIVNAIIDIIDSDFQPKEHFQLKERVEMVEPSNEAMDDAPGICYEEGTFPSTEPVRNTKAAYEPVITQVNNGFTVRCGCQTFVFETFDKMSKYLKMYFEDPAETEEKFYKNELFK